MTKFKLNLIPTNSIASSNIYLLGKFMFIHVIWTFPAMSNEILSGALKNTRKNNYSIMSVFHWQQIFYYCMDLNLWMIEFWKFINRLHFVDRKGKKIKKTLRYVL